MKTSKRILSLILCCIMIVSLIPMTVSADVTHIYYGDLNENGRVEASDARLVLQKAASLITLTDRQMALADVNQDGRVTAMDARATLRTAARIEEPVIFETIGTEDDTDEFISIYVEFLRAQSKEISSNAEYGGKTGSVRNYKFSDAAICYIDSDDTLPELVVCYSGADLYTLYRFYCIEDGAVKMFREFADVRGMYSYGTMMIWNDPCENSHAVLYERVSAASMHSEYDCEIIFPSEHKIISIASAYDYVSATMKTTAEYADGYEKFFEFDDRTDVANAVESYCLYKFKNQESSVLQFSIINKDGSIEEKVIEDSEQPDPVMIYADFIRTTGKSRKIYSTAINSEIDYYFCDSAVCKLDKNSDIPQLVLIYFNENVWNDPYQPIPSHNIEIYTIKDGMVELVDTFQFDSIYCDNQFIIWRDPTTNELIFTNYHTFEGHTFKTYYPVEKELFSNTWGMDNPYYAPGYENYITDTDIVTHINKYSVYTFKKTTSDNICINIIEDNNVITETFTF